MLEKLKRLKLYKLGLITIGVIGLLLRINQLYSRELWYDEAYSGLLVRKNWTDMFVGIKEDVHPPLYYILLKLWVIFFGNTPTTLRTMSIVCGMVLLAAIALWANYIFRQSIARSLIMTFIFAISPFFVVYAVEARTYSLAATLFVLASYCIFRATEKGFKFNIYWLLLALLLPAMFLTHYALLFGILSLLIWLFLQPKLHAAVAFNFKQTCGFLMLVVLPLVVTVVLWLPTLIYQFHRNSNLGWIPKSEATLFARSTYAYLFGVNNHALGVPPINELRFFPHAETLGLILFLIICIGAVNLLRTKSRLVTLLLCTSILPISLIIIASWFGLHMYVERYLIGYGVMLITLLVFIIGQLRLRYVTVLLLAYLVSLLLIIPVDNKTDFVQMAAYITDHKTVITSPLDAVVLRYYLLDDQDTNLKVLDLDNKQGYASWSIITPDRVISKLNQLDNDEIILVEDGKNIGLGHPITKFAHYQAYQLP